MGLEGTARGPLSHRTTLEANQTHALRAHRACIQTLENLEIALRELHALRRGLGDVGLRTDHVSSEFIRATEMAPLFVDLALVYLRRLADMFAYSFRFIAFEHPNSVRDTFTRMRTLLTDEAKRSKHTLRCDGAALARIFSEETGWFGLLRGDPDSVEEHGYRDLLEHFRALLVVTARQTEGERAVLSADLFDSQKKEPTPIEMIDGIQEILAGMCRFWTAIYRLCGTGDGYVRASDVWLNSEGGNKEDVTGFWPRLPM